VLTEELKKALLGRVAVVAVGDARRGDDAVGPVIAGMLAEVGVENVIDGGASPEIETWRVRELAPDTVLFIDAVDFGGAPGDVAILAPGDLRSKGFDTHRAPLKLTMEYLENELVCTCRLLAIQPRDVRQGALMCEDVRRSAENMAEMLAEHLHPGLPEEAL
jgi:hydrogenase 3 maturation protease